MKKYVLSLILPMFAALSLTASAQSLSMLNSLLATPDGDQTSVAELGEGKVTVVSFWATWCKPCKEEMKAMQKVYDELASQGLEYIAVSIDDTKTMARVGPYISAKGYTFPVLQDPNKELFNSVNGTEVPYTLVYAADGSLSNKHQGYLEGDEQKLAHEVKELMAQAGMIAPPEETNPAQ